MSRWFWVVASDGEEYKWFPRFICCPVNRQFLWKKTQIEKKNKLEGNSTNSSVIYRSRYQSCSIKQVFLKHFAKFTGRNLSQSLFVNKVRTLLKKRLWSNRCFPVNLAKFLKALFYRTPFDNCFWIYKNFNPGHNVLELYKILVQVRFSTSKTKLDI